MMFDVCVNCKLCFMLYHWSCSSTVASAVSVVGRGGFMCSGCGCVGGVV